jgi:hypothetical protein
MNVNVVPIVKLRAALSDYQVVIQGLSDRLSFLSQDIDLLLEETEQGKDGGHNA